MSSRATTPSSSLKGGGSASKSGGVASLSNDALYTPLSSIQTDHHPHNNDQTQMKKKIRHSLTLRTSSSLRESSLVTFLASMGKNIKTSHPQECHVFRGLGEYGNGDNCRVDTATRSNLESKLSNRSLVLVGGGIHTHAPTASTMTGGDDALKSGGVAGSKRKRKRVGGYGVFGCKSHRQRKKTMSKIKKIQSSESGVTPTAGKVDEGVGNIVETLHQMWINYVQQMLSSLKKNKAKALTSLSQPLSLEVRSEVATILATSEHIGMAATIVACPARRHLEAQRCIVLNETKETFKIAILKRHLGQSQKKVIKSKDGVSSTKSFHWKVVLMPKHKTTLDVSIPWSSASDRIIVRLET